MGVLERKIGDFTGIKSTSKRHQKRLGKQPKIIAERETGRLTLPPCRTHKGALDYRFKGLCFQDVVVSEEEIEGGDGRRAARAWD